MFITTDEVLQAKVFSFCRCFLSAGSPASSTAKNRLVEALCIHLCTEITQPRRQNTLSGQRMYTSRFKLILQAYNRVRQRLLNSEALLDRTNLTVFVINKHTLTKWYKSRVRREEVTTLLQGVVLPQHHSELQAFQIHNRNRLHPLHHLRFLTCSWIRKTLLVRPDLETQVQVHELY